LAVLVVKLTEKLNIMTAEEMKNKKITDYTKKIVRFKVTNVAILIYFQYFRLTQLKRRICEITKKKKPPRKR
jgi:hypothetical protein